MDFAFQKRLEQTFDRTSFYDKDAQMYHHFVYDFLYQDATNTLAFIDNHDLERWFSRIRSKAKLKQALGILLTSPRIPQIYYGTEWMFSGDGKGKEMEIFVKILLNVFLILIVSRTRIF
jgi:glycosidase